MVINPVPTPGALTHPDMVKVPAGGGPGWAGGRIGVATCAKAGAEAAMSTSPMNVSFIGMLPTGPGPAKAGHYV